MDTLTNLSFRVRGKCGDTVYGVTDGVQWSRAWFIPPNPETAIQQNNRHAFRLVNLLFSGLDAGIKYPWIELSQKKVLPKPNFFVKRGMLSYIAQLGVSVYADSVELSGVYPSDKWTWTAA